MTWQPIETAPKDGARVRLGHIEDASSMKLDSLFRVTGYWNGELWDASAFFLVPGGKLGLMTTQPTHWMPLPSPPENLR